MTGKKNKKPTKKTVKSHPKVLPVNQPSETKSSKLWKITAGVAAIITIVLGVFFIKDRFFKPEKEIQQEADKTQFITGHLNPPPLKTSAVTCYSLDKPFVFNANFINNKINIIKGIHVLNNKPDASIVFSFGLFDRVIVPIGFLINGIRINVHGYNGCDDTQFIFGIKNERLYLSTEFKDLQKEQIVGTIEYNYWKISRENYFAIKNDDERLEVRDKQNYIVFTIKYELSEGNLNTVFIGGYFISPSSIRIIQNYAGEARYYDTCYSKNDIEWKRKAEINISKIQSNFQ